MTQATANPEQIEPTTIVSITMRYGGARGGGEPVVR
jgi:hypothetical protein